jgi:hypothetical protein
MSLSREDVAEYLREQTSLTTIDNDKVRDKKGRKDNQIPLTIELAKTWIDDILTREESREDELLTSKEWNSLIDLNEALEELPRSMSLRTLWKVTTDLDGIQKRLVENVTQYINNVTNFDEHRSLLKAVVLVLKIFQYDLGKKSGAMTFFAMEVLSSEKRVENHSLVSDLLDTVIAKFNPHYVSSHSKDEDKDLMPEAKMAI